MDDQSCYIQHAERLTMLHPRYRLLCSCLLILCVYLCCVVYRIVSVTYCMSCVMKQDRTPAYVAPEVQAGLVLFVDIVCVLCCVPCCTLCTVLCLSHTACLV